MPLKFSFKTSSDTILINPNNDDSDYWEKFKKEYKDFHFLVLDKGSLDIGIFNCSEEFYYRGEEKVEKALDLYNKFFIEGADLDNYCLTGEL